MFPRVLFLTQTRGNTYFDKVKTIAPANLIGYWPMSELSGSVATDYSGRGNHGAYTGVTLGQPGIGDGRTCPLFDGTNDFNNIYSAALASDFNASEGSLWGWMKVGAAGVWTDGTIDSLATLVVDGNNRIEIFKTATNNQLQFRYRAGGTSKDVTSTALNGSIAFFHIAITWSVAADQMKAYINGAQVGTTQTGLGTWAGSLAAASTLLGAGGTLPSTPSNGYQAHWGLHTTPLPLADIQKLATV